MKKELFEVVSEIARPDYSGVVFEANGVRFINVTPHPVIVIRSEGNLVIPPSGYLVRVEEESEKVADVLGIDIRRMKFGKVSIPQPVWDAYREDPDKTYIVSGRITADALVEGYGEFFNPSHVLIPAGIVRGVNGEVVGATFFGLSDKINIKK